MAQFARSLDVYQGFNFKKDKQAPVGFISTMKLGELELKADQETVMDPENPTKALEGGAVGILSHYMWEMGTTDAIYMSAQVSVQNKQELSAKLLTDWTNMEVVFSYVIYEYDPKEKKYFKSNWTETDLKGILEKSGDNLNLTVADDPSTEVQSPKNFTLQVGIKPQTLEQMVNMATGTGKNLSKIWGITADA
jgi:hypothetical protein